MHNKFMVGLTCSIILSGCTTSPSTFIKNSTELSDLDVCQNYLADGGETFKKESIEDTARKTYLASLQEQFLTRGLTESKCKTITEKNAAGITAVVIGVAAVSAIGYKIHKDKKECEKNYKKCKSTGSGGYTSSAGNNTGSRNSTNKMRSPTIKTANVKNAPKIKFTGNHRKDYFYDEFGNLTSRCRDADNGQFVSNANCIFAPDNDDTWPEK